MRPRNLLDDWLTGFTFGFGVSAGVITLFGVLELAAWLVDSPLRVVFP